MNCSDKINISDKRPYKLLGCYLDSSDRDLNKAAVVNGRMSIKTCYKKCRRLKYPYFGVQNGKSCYCGRHYGRYGKRNMAECSYKCNDNTKEYCGGSWRNMVFRIKKIKGE